GLRGTHAVGLTRERGPVGLTRHQWILGIGGVVPMICQSTAINGRGRRATAVVGTSIWPIRLTACGAHCPGARMREESPPACPRRPALPYSGDVVRSEGAMPRPLLELLEALAKRTDMYVGTVSFATVRSYLHGLAAGCEYAGLGYTPE